MRIDDTAPAHKNCEGADHDDIRGHRADHARYHHIFRHRDLHHCAARPTPVVRMDAGARPRIGLVGRRLPARRVFGGGLEHRRADLATLAVEDEPVGAVPVLDYV